LGMPPRVIRIDTTVDAPPDRVSSAGPAMTPFREFRSVKTILVVDDEENVRFSLESVFHRQYRVVGAENGETEAAVETFSRIPPEAGSYVDARLYWAFLLEDESRLDEAIRVIKEALEHEADDDRLWGFLAALYEHGEDYEKAIECARKALDTSKHPAKHYFTLGVLYDKEGDLTRSIESMKKVISLEPDNAEALNYLGYTYADKGIRLDEAEDLIRKALAIRPEDGYIVDSLGWVYFKQGRYDEALKELKQAQKLIPDDPVILEHLGDAHQKVENYPRALEMYKRAREKAKDQAKISQKIEKVELILEPVR